MARRSGFAAARAESRWLSVRNLRKKRLCLGRRSRQELLALTESQRLSAREAAKPQNRTMILFCLGLEIHRAAIVTDAGANPSAVAFKVIAPALPFDCTIAIASP